MKSLLTRPLLMVLLTACGSSATRSDTEVVESTETAESAICNLANCPNIDHYYCDLGGAHCGPCEAYNAVTCFTVPEDGNYRTCTSSCSAGFYVTQYSKRFNCDIAATPKLAVSCFKPDPGTTTFPACGLNCPAGFTRIATWYSSGCDSSFAMDGDSSNTVDNSMRCDRTP